MLSIHWILLFFHLHLVNSHPIFYQILLCSLFLRLFSMTRLGPLLMVNFEDILFTGMTDWLIDFFAGCTFIFCFTWWVSNAKFRVKFVQAGQIWWKIVFILAGDITSKMIWAKFLFTLVHLFYFILSF